VSPAPAPHGRPDQEEPTDQEQREQEEPGEEPSRPVADDMHDLHLLAGLLPGLHLLDALRDAGVLAGPVGPDPNADPPRGSSPYGCDHHSSTHLTTSFTRVCIHVGAEM
jgi:hypothetical protein